MFMVLSLFLFFCDYRFHCFDVLHSKLSFVTLPLQYIVNLPLVLAHKLNVNFIGKTVILKENERLTAELLLVNARLQRLNFLEHENIELRTLLHGSHKIKGSVLSAKIIMSEVDNFGQKVTISKGERDGVYIKQPVLDAHGLLGQVVSVEKNMSKVLLVTNNKSVVPVVVVRSGLQTVALGVGTSDYLELTHVHETADVKERDIVVTSGLGLHFPAGYQVGVVKEIKHVIGKRFMKIFVVPSAHINRVSHVLLVWPDLTIPVKQTKKSNKKH